MSLPAPPSQSAPTQSANQQASTYAHPHTQKLHDLQIFLNAAPALLHEELQQLSDEERSQARMKRFLLPSGDYVSCIWWDGIFHITGTDVVRSLVFRFEVSGRPVRNIKKFEEGVFSDLRNLKPGVASVMEEAKSPFLDLLFRHQCIRTQKKQKVFYWFEVDHDRLYLDALDRDLKREKLGMEPTTGELGASPAFDYDPRQSLSEQFIGPNISDGAADGSLERALRHLGSAAQISTPFQGIDGSSAPSAGPGFVVAATGSTSVVNMTARSHQEHADYPTTDDGRIRKRFSDGKLAMGSQSPEDKRWEHGHVVTANEDSTPAQKKRRGNDEESMDADQSPPPRYNPAGNTSSHQPQYTSQQQLAGSSTDHRASSAAAGRASGWHADASSLPADVTPSLASTSHTQSRPSGEVRVVHRTTPEHGGGEDPLATRGTHPAEEELRLTCPVPICRQVYIGKQTMLLHMRTHNEQDWMRSSQSSALSGAVATSYPQLSRRSHSADALGNPLYLDLNISGQSTNRSLHTPIGPGETIPDAAYPSFPAAQATRKGWSPAPSALSVESAPALILNDQYSYLDSRSQNNNPIHALLSLATARTTPTPPISRRSAEIMNISNHPGETPRYPSSSSGPFQVATTPPSRISFRPQPPAKNLNRMSWNGEVQPPSLASVRRVRSETPAIGTPELQNAGAQYYPSSTLPPASQPPMFGNAHSTRGHLDVPPSYTSQVSNVRQSTPDIGSSNGDGKARPAVHMYPGPAATSNAGNAGASHYTNIYANSPRLSPSAAGLCGSQTAASLNHPSPGFIEHHGAYTGPTRHYRPSSTSPSSLSGAILPQSSPNVPSPTYRSSSTTLPTAPLTPLSSSSGSTSTSIPYPYATHSNTRTYGYPIERNFTPSTSSYAV